ncbi:hypothetical protein IRJ41_021419 [Triplophysa rosa]|uniref:Uncharacterized protein n=1 Tax=Triplophysa rosa TaxID=992332 RepID=A0A9W7TGA3_TRIRA|nr:hypothetical protein IRJ41_021419 [Triplophysa rosa]
MCCWVSDIQQVIEAAPSEGPKHAFIKVNLTTEGSREITQHQSTIHRLASLCGRKLTGTEKRRQTRRIDQIVESQISPNVTWTIKREALQIYESWFCRALLRGKPKGSTKKGKPSWSQNSVRHSGECGPSEGRRHVGTEGWASH